MAFNTSHKTLFELSILHSYFLNSGSIEFDSMPVDKKIKLLKNYNFENFLEVVPTEKTKRKIRNNHLVYSPNRNVLKIGVKTSIDNENLTFIDIALDTTLDFIIRIKDSFFENYSNLSITPNQIFYISNTKPVDEPVSFNYIPLSTDAVFIDDGYKLSELSTAKILDLLEGYERRGLFGIVSIKIEADLPELSVLTDLKEIKSPPPSFKIHFENRKTIWKYIKSNSSFEVETSLPKPLTQNGFVEIIPTDFTTSPPDVDAYQYPNPSVKSIQKTALLTYSQIFI